MNDERDYLTNKVFPRIKHEAKSKGVNIRFIDLRWGITEEEAKQGRVIETCLREIDECRPFFIGLLGERYGWIPRYQDLGGMQERLLNKYNWLRNDVDEGLSITEMEMQYAALRNSNIEYAHFYIRSSEMPTPSEYQEPIGSIAAEKLRQLKNKIRSQGKYPVDNYVSVENLGQLVYDNLKELLDKYVQENSDSMVVRHNLHEFNVRMRTENYVGNVFFEEKIKDWLNSSSRFLLISGNTYTGKSTHLCHLLQKYRSLNSLNKAIYHDVELRDTCSTKYSSSAVMLEHITSEFALLYGDKEKVYKDVVEIIIGIIKFLFSIFFYSIIAQFKLSFSSMKKEDIESDNAENTRRLFVNMLHYSPVKRLTKYLKKVASAKDSIIIFIDNIDEFSDEEEKELVNIMNIFPTNVRFVISVRSGSIGETVLRNGLEISQIVINGFDREMARIFAQKYLSTYSKNLSDYQFDLLLNGFYINNPYLFSLVLEQLVSFGSFEDLDKEIRCFSALVDKKSLCQKIVEGLFVEFEDIFAVNPLSMSLCALALSNRGLNEEEIEKGLELKPVEWSAVRGHVLSLCTFLDDKFQIKDNDIKDSILKLVKNKEKEFVLLKLINYFEGLIDFRHRSRHLDRLQQPDAGAIVEDGFKNQRQAEELPSLYVHVSAFDKLFAYVIFVYNDCYFTKNERIKYWSVLYRNGYAMSPSRLKYFMEDRMELVIHSEELIPVKADYRKYYKGLAETASVLQQSGDYEWAMEHFYMCQDEKVKNNFFKKDGEVLTQMNKLLISGKFKDCIAYGMMHHVSDAYMKIRVDILMGLAYQGAGEYSSAIKLWQKIMETAKNQSPVDMELLSEATVYYCSLRSDFSDKNILKETISILAEVSNYQLGIGLQNETTNLMLLTYGKLYFKLKEYDTALTYFNDANQSSQMLYGKNSYHSCVVLGLLGQAQLMIGQIENADTNLRIAIDGIEKNNPKNQKLLCEMLVYRYAVLYELRSYDEALKIRSYAEEICELSSGKISQEDLRQQIRNVQNDRLLYLIKKTRKAREKLTSSIC